MTMENGRGEPKRSLPDKLLNNVYYYAGVSTSSKIVLHSLQLRISTEQITGSPYSDNDCPVKVHGTARDTVPVESDVNVENTREGKLFHGYSVSDDSKLPCSEADQSKNTACGTEQVSDVDLDVIRQKEGSFKECAVDEMKSTKCETGEVVPDSGTAASAKTLKKCFGVTCTVLKYIATCFGAAGWETMANIPEPVLASMCKTMADICCFVGSACKRMAVIFWLILASVFKEVVVTAVFKGMADISWPVLTSLCKTAAFKRLADHSGATSACNRLAVSFVPSVCMAVSVCKSMSDIVLLAVVEVWKRLTLRLGSKTAKSKAVDVHFTGWLVTAFLVGLLCGFDVTDATTLLPPTQPLSEQCIRLFSSTFGNDCPLSLIELSIYIEMYYKPLNTTCCSEFPGTVFHCQTDHFDNGKGDQYTMLGCMPPVTVPRGFSGRISAYNTEKPYFRTVRDNDSPYTEQYDRQSWKVPHPYHFSHFKSKCNGVDQEMFCGGTDGDDNLCTCREGFQPSCDGSFTDNSACACVEMVCPPGSAPSRSSVERDVACKNLSDGQYPQFTCSPASTHLPSGHPASLTTGTPPMTTPDNHDTPAVGKTGEGSLGGSVIAFVLTMIVLLLVVFTVVCGNTVKDKVCEAWYHMRGYRQPNSA